jgi:hypothetical protein
LLSFAEDWRKEGSFVAQVTGHATESKEEGDVDGKKKRRLTPVADLHAALIRDPFLIAQIVLAIIGVKLRLHCRLERDGRRPLDVWEEGVQCPAPGTQAIRSLPAPLVQRRRRHGQDKL